MISHAKGDASWHREQRGIKTPEQKRIEELEAEVKRLKSTERFLRSERPMARKMTELEAELAECKRDAERWREYQARKIRLTEAGFGKSPLRDAAIADMGEKK